MGVGTWDVVGANNDTCECTLPLSHIPRAYIRESAMAFKPLIKISQQSRRNMALPGRPLFPFHNTTYLHESHRSPTALLLPLVYCQAGNLLWKQVIEEAAFRVYSICLISVCSRSVTRAVPSSEAIC